MPSENRQILDQLFASGQINLQRGAVFDAAPDPLPDDFDFDKIEGMMLGLAIGDALGITTEGWRPEERRETFGEIRDYLPDPSGKAPTGYPSDDTQLAFWTLEQLLADGRFSPANVAARFCRDTVFGIGSTVSRFIANHKAGVPWHECGPDSASNGALMRIAPVLIPHVQHPSADLWVDTALSAMMTHNSAGSTAACLSFVHMLWQLLGTDVTPEPRWWPAVFVRVAEDLEGPTCHLSGSPLFHDYEGPIHGFVEEQVGRAYRDGLTVQEACDRWRSGAFLLETVPSVLFILMRHADDPEEAVVRSVNDTKDNDTIAAIVGAAVGALHGRANIPDRWIANLSGCTTMEDHGKVFELLGEARERWG